MKEQRKPWNPYPLAALKAAGLSPCAKQVFTALAARSNYFGEVYTGIKGLMVDTSGSHGYVTNGLKELYEKGRLKKAKARYRRGGKSDLKTVVCSREEIMASGISAESLEAIADAWKERESKSPQNGLMEDLKVHDDGSKSPREDSKSPRDSSKSPQCGHEPLVSEPCVLEPFEWRTYSLETSTKASQEESQDTIRDSKTSKTPKLFEMEVEEV